MTKLAHYNHFCKMSKKYHYVNNEHVQINLVLYQIFMWKWEIDNVKNH